ncbi:Glycosyl transferase family 1 [Hyella patelloides LEGE 07179]|uniref:Glycosyl transferase family 1 n=1 Tax=Hyella patelloides LEGE 07179 TaxID=945734 RepID=A0A563VSS6_9CYAN|nr:glycosyltransferase [Hyella patelloides]VEP14266.1 Glycosyl transferase family 1 [Hyella patelloides LEGE 07179]VEP14432.1 Glycosyl transferase family 1 [Hyella patelloides LEGE 07179]
MTHFGIICPPAIGHLNPMCALGGELQRRNHSVTIFGIADIEPKIKNSGLNFWLIGEQEFPLGILEQNYEKLGKKSGREGLKFTIELILKDNRMLFNNLPTAIQSAGIEALLVDQVSTAGGTIADKLELPYVTVCNALLVNREAGVPPYFTHWGYNQAWWAKLRNQLGNWFLNRISLSIWQEIQQQRQQWQLPLYKNRDDNYSKLAQICQLPREFDFPRVNLPDHFHYTGPLQNPSGLESVSFPDISFPWEKLTDKPLVYASLGTLQNKVPEIFQSIAEAVAGLDVQLVISLGNPNNNPADYNLPDNIIAVSFAPHQKLIDRASVVITHAGMNTTLGALSSGVPIVAIPITNEQPGIAARIARTGAGEVVRLQNLNISRLQTVIKQVLTESSYQQNAQRLQEAIHQAGGVRRAADIVEQVVATGKPVLAP